MAEWLVVGGLVFWVSIIAWVAILWAFLETERGFLGFLSVVAYGCLLQFGFHVDVLHMLWSVAWWAGPGYFILGTIWGCIRWYLYALEQANKFVEMKMEWLSSKGQSGDTVPPDMKEMWAKHLDMYDHRTLAKTPLVREHKSRIMGWIGYWPLSLVSWLFNDMVRGIVKAIYLWMAEWLQSIANSAFAKVRKDLPDDFK